MKTILLDVIFFLPDGINTKLESEASEMRHKSVEVEFEFLVFSYKSDDDKSVVQIWCKNFKNCQR